VTASGPERLQVGIVPNDVAASMAFYRDVLGLAYDGARPGLEGRTVHFFSVGPSMLKLLESPRPLTDRPDPGAYAETAGIRWITLDVADLARVVQRCRDSGARFQLEPAEIRPGLRVAIVEDPDGNAIELVERR
jgi:catechol 2,3-dioxygenase-like lactoylglutathione lyase family enzyme